MKEILDLVEPNESTCVVDIKEALDTILLKDSAPFKWFVGVVTDAHSQSKNLVNKNYHISKYQNLMILGAPQFQNLRLYYKIWNRWFTA